MRSDIQSGEVPEALLAVQNPSGAAMASREPASSNRGPRTRRNVNPPPPSTSTYYFYQATSGTPIFLHPLDIRILLAHYSSYAAFPDRINLRVEAFSEGTINDDLRKRCKYLAHMPEGADVVFVEADLENVVGRAGLVAFEGALKLRRNKRVVKGRKEDNAKNRAEEKDRERMFQGLVASAAGLALAPHRNLLSAADAISDSPETQTSPSLSVAVEANGAWGARSFASALHSTAPSGAGTSSRLVRDEEAGWEVDMAWRDLEEAQRVSAGAGGGKKKGRKKLVLLGGGPGRRA